MKKNQKNKIKGKPRDKAQKNTNNINSNKEPLNQEKIIIPKNNIKLNQIHNKVVEPYSIGEAIAKIIIEKIIVISVRNVELKEVYSKYKYYYFNYLKKQINSMFSLNNMFYTEEPNNIEYSKFWKTEYSKCNTWVEIMEPKSIKCDRYEGICVKNILYDNNDNISINDTKKSITDTDLLKKDNNIDKKEFNIKLNKNRKNFKKITLQSNLESLQEVGSDSGDEEQIQHKEKKSLFRNSYTNKTIRDKEKKMNIIQGLSLRQNINSKNKSELFEFPSEEIPGINNEFNFDKYDPPEIEVLRKAYEKLNNEKLAKKLLSLKKTKVLILDNITNEKKFDSDKLTFDSNGEIIKFKPLNINSLSNDFRQLKNNIIISTQTKKLSLPKNKIKQFGFKKKSTISRVSNDFLNVVKNPDDDPDLNKSLFAKINPEKKIKVIHSGDNFSLMLPSVGVVVKEETKIKKGNRDFGSYFKKYSLEDYNKILNEYLPIENQNIVKNKIQKKQSKILFTNNNHNNNIMSL